MNEQTAREYRRIRRAEPFTSAASAYQLAKWRVTAPTMDDGDTWTNDGFDMRVSVVYDDYPYDGDDRPTFHRYATAESVSVRGIMAADDDYAETPYCPRSQRIADYRRRGATRALAVELAHRDMIGECYQHLDSDNYTTHVITVRASAAGVELGRASLGGVTFGAEYGDDSRYIAECAAELELEAIEDARQTFGPTRPPYRGSEAVMTTTSDARLAGTPVFLFSDAELDVIEHALEMHAHTLDKSCDYAGVLAKIKARRS